MGSLMSRTWMLRGVATAVFAVLVGAWVVGFAGTDEKPPLPENVVKPISPDSAPWQDTERSPEPGEKKPRRTRGADPSRAALTESPDAVVEPAANTPSAPASPDQTTAPPSASHEPSNPPSSPHTPGDPPTQPDEECTDLDGAIDCALEPVTDRP